MRSSLYLTTLALISSVRAAADVHLAVSPKCGSLSGVVADVNAGLRDLRSYTTHVTFGDSYSTSRVAGTLSNGPSWVEYLANSSNAKLRNYAANGAVVDATAYVDSNPSPDFFTQIGNFIQQASTNPSLNPDTTLYSVFFGIEDFVKSKGFTTLRPVDVAGEIEYGILQLTSSPVFAKNILVVDNYARGSGTQAGEEFKQALFTGLDIAATRYGLNIAYVDLANVWNGVLGSNPGYKAFGYTSAGACVTAAGVCRDPAHTFYYRAGIPSTATSKIIADYVQAVIKTC